MNLGWGGKAQMQGQVLERDSANKQLASNTGSIWENTSFCVMVLDGTAQNPPPFVKQFID